MMRWAAFSLLFVGLVAFGTVQGQGKFNKKISVGSSAPTWSKLPGTDGKKHSLSDLKDKDVVVMVVTCNHCPVAVAYEDRIIDLTRKYGSRVGVVAINVNSSEEDRLPKMIERAREKGFNFPYLYDESQDVGRAYGASVTPEFFVLNKERKIVYMGAMDDSISPQNVKTSYVEPAVDAALKGSTPAVSETRARGCGVQYER
jgi:peroxiredoxin